MNKVALQRSNWEALSKSDPGILCKNYSRPDPDRFFERNDTITFAPKPTAAFFILRDHAKYAKAIHTSTRVAKEHFYTTLFSITFKLAIASTGAGKIKNVTKSSPYAFLAFHTHYAYHPM